MLCYGLVFWLAAFFHLLLFCLSYLLISLLRNSHLCSQFSGEVKFTLVHSKAGKRRNLAVKDAHLLQLYFTTTNFEFKRFRQCDLPPSEG